MKNQTETPTVREHLDELRSRLFWVVGTFMIGALPGLIFTKTIVHILTAPLGENLYFSTPAGGMNFVMQICLITGLIFAIPVIIFQGVQFVRPTSKVIKTSLAVKVMVLSGIMAIVGVLYAYYFSLPGALHFLTTFAGDYIKPLLSASDYLSFVMTYLVGSALIFQVPLILYFINHIRPFKPGTLSKWQRHVIAGSVIFAGIITPTPDPYNQMMIAVPLIVLFEASTFVIWITRPRMKSIEVPKIKKTHRAFKAIPMPEYTSESFMPQQTAGAVPTMSFSPQPARAMHDEDTGPRIVMSVDPMKRIDRPRRSHHVAPPVVAPKPDAVTYRIPIENHNVFTSLPVQA